MVNSTAARRAKVVSLVESGSIHSQSDLVKELKRAGYKVTQATASRDLDEIGAVRGSHGYQLSNSSDDSLSRVILIGDLILSVEASGNLAVVRTPPGGAQLLASNLDHEKLKSIIGTIAGDDTVLVVSRKSNGGAELAKELTDLGKPNSKTSKKRGKK